MSSGGPTPSKIRRVEDGGCEEEDDQALRELTNCQSEIEKLNKKMSIKIIQVGDKYNRLRKPHYDKRAELIEKIPNFWGKAILNHPRIKELIEIEEVECPCLNFLRQINLEDFEKDNGFRIKFVFSENPYFENEEITKELYFGPESESKSTSSIIRWKEGEDLSQKQAEGTASQQKTFFSWFSYNEDPDSDEIANIIKEDIWPDALQYYLYSIVQNSYMGDDEESFSDDEGEDGSHDEADEEDTSDDEAEGAQQI